MSNPVTKKVLYSTIEKLRSDPAVSIQDLFFLLELIVEKLPMTSGDLEDKP